MGLIARLLLLKSLGSFLAPWTDFFQGESSGIVNEAILCTNSIQMLCRYLPYIPSNQEYHACVTLKELSQVTCLGCTADCAVLGLKAKCLSRDRIPLQVIEMLSSLQPPKNWGPQAGMYPYSQGDLN